MAVLRPLSRPPIREAIVEVKCEPVELRRVDALRERLERDFPTAQPFRLASLALHLPDERRGAEPDAAGGRATGWRCESADSSEVALIRQDGLSFGRLASYPGWDVFTDRFLSIWGTFVDIAQPVEVRRISVRYVNDLRLPIGDQFHFERFLTTAPRPPAGLAPEIADFLTQMTLPGGADGLRVAVTQASDAASRSTTELPVTLDIDVTWDRPMPVDERLPARLSDALGTLRDLKNRVFFGLVTEELVSAYS
ncbi:MAG: TIGR04255 family protein [Burkholderiales bacterium]|nr:MAG: TIGR04255 family protein [Burkholderiales bacterium]